MVAQPHPFKPRSSTKWSTVMQVKSLEMNPSTSEMLNQALNGCQFYKPAIAHTDGPCADVAPGGSGRIVG
jgi:hypothetical protein